MKREITFDGDGLTLVGHLLTPDNFDEPGHYEAVIVEGSFTSVKEQMPSTCAEKFATQGFVALAFDYAHYGESAGEPRQLESPGEKLADLQAAVSYLSELPYGRWTEWSLATLAAFLPSPALYSAMYGEEGLARLRQKAGESRRKYEESGEVDIVAAYSEVAEQPAVITVRLVPTITT